MLYFRKAGSSRISNMTRTEKRRIQSRGPNSRTCVLVLLLKAARIPGSNIFAMFTTFAFYVLLWRLGIVALTTESVDQACCLAAQSVPPSDSRSPSVSIDPPITNKQQIHTLEIVAVNTLIENFQNKQMLNCQRFEGSEILETMNPTPSSQFIWCPAQHTTHTICTQYLIFILRASWHVSCPSCPFTL